MCICQKKGRKTMRKNQPSVNQILITDKVFITPEFKRKKNAYKWEFIVSIFLVCCLFSYYIYAEYDKSKSEEVSKEVLSKIDQELGNVSEDNQAKKTTDNVIIVAIDGPTNKSGPFQYHETQTSINVDEITAKDEIDSTVYKASDGTLYRYDAIINIPKINVKYPVIEPITADIRNQDYTAILKISPCKFYGADPNTIGNFCIAGHNYRNEKFFSKVPTLENGDDIYITDATGKVVQYKVFKKYNVVPEDTGCLDPDVHGKREVTLITCTNDNKHRVIVKAVEI